MPKWLIWGDDGLPDAVYWLSMKSFLVLETFPFGCPKARESASCSHQE